MKFSYVIVPTYPLKESLASIKLADELGYHAVYAADETWWKDLWLLFAAAAADTTQIRMGPSVSGVVLREPTLIAQAAATLDELSDGRAEVVLSSGNFGLLAQHGIDWTKTKPLSRVKEGVQVIRTLLDDGAITHDGEFFNYNGLFTFARPVQEHLPVKMGAMKGPKSFEVSAEFSDGCHHALSYTKEAYEYMMKHCTIGAERAGKDVQDLDLGAWVVFSVRRGLGGRQGRGPQPGRPLRIIDAGRPAPAQRCRARGDGPDHRGHRCRRHGQGHRAHLCPISPSASPSRARRRSARRRCRARSPPPGINHLILAITDKAMVKSLMGRDDRRRSGRRHPAPADPRPGDARLRLNERNGEPSAAWLCIVFPLRHDA